MKDGRETTEIQGMLRKKPTHLTAVQFSKISKWCTTVMSTCGGEHRDSEQPHPDQSSTLRICLAFQTERMILFLDLFPK